MLERILQLLVLKFHANSTQIIPHMNLDTVSLKSEMHLIILVKFCKRFELDFEQSVLSFVYMNLDNICLQLYGVSKNLALL